MKQLNVRELLDACFEQLKVRLNPEVRIKRFSYLVGDDSDHHSNRYGYISYSDPIVAKRGDRYWILANGQSSGGYLASSYEGDIIAIPCVKYPRGDVALHQTLRPFFFTNEGQRGNYFGYSVVVAMRTGELTQSSRSGFPSLVRQASETYRGGRRFKTYPIEHRNRDCVNLQTFLPRNTKYDSELANNLAGWIIQSLV